MRLVINSIDEFYCVGFLSGTYFGLLVGEFILTIRLGLASEQEFCSYPNGRYTG
jgi:hypothetical protein